MFISLATCVICLLTYNADAVCTWPSDFVSSTWIDSEKGNAVFQTTTVTGFAFTVGSTVPITISEWECVVYDEAGPYLVMKTTTTFVQFVTNVLVAYKCLKLTKITDASYRYYQIDPIQANINSERLFINENTELSSVADLCLEELGASGSEYRVLVKSGSEGVSQITCPYVILADYSYTYITSDGSVSCDPTTDVGQLDMCTNSSLFTFQYPPCTSLTVYSSSSTVWCTDVVTVGGDIFVALFNGIQDAATIDDSNTYQFSCIGINTDGTRASVTPQFCKQNQSPDQIPTDNSGSSVGAVLALSRTGDYCPPCPNLDAPLLGSVSVSTEGAVTTATYTCDSGYTISGDATQVCQSNGTWSGSSPTCTCALPAAPANGSVALSGDGLTLTYACDVGTVLIGETTRTCQTETNTWTGTEPTCDACETLPQPTNGSYIITSTGLTSIVTYSCDVGTSVSGGVSRTCQQDTTWDGTAPTCVACPSLSNPASGTLSITTDGLASIATYTCSTGYYVKGVDTSTCIDGVWNSSEPTCVCDAPVSPANGTANVSADGYTVTYTCDVGFTLSGQSILTCQTDGSGWDATFPICAECAILTSPANGSLALSTNGTLTVVTYSCDVGFSMNGDVTSECSTTGVWSTASPTCTQCDTLTSPTSANITYITDGTTTSAQYTCDVGSTLNGDVTITCDSNGAWTSTVTNISCVTCPSLTSTAGGMFQVTSDGTTSSAEFTCQSGYTLSGATTSTCLPDGMWSSEEPSCVPNTTAGEDGSNSLLPAVIALAILVVVLATAFVCALIYIYRQRKKRENKSDKPSEYDKIPEPDSRYILGKMLHDAAKSSAAPVGHQHHVFNIGSSSMSRAPSSHMSSGSFWSDSVTPGPFTPSSSVLSGPMSMPGSATPRSAKSAGSAKSVGSAKSIGSAKSTLSTTKMKLDLVKEATSSSFNLDTDVPAPWTIHGNSPRKSPRGKNMKSPRRTQTEKLENPLIPKKGVSEELKLDLSSVVDTPRDNWRTKKRTRSPRKHRANSFMNNDITGRERTFVKDKQRTQERATTPVRHILTVKDVETPRTPRSYHIATVQ